MRVIEGIIKDDPDITVVAAAAAADIPQSSLYRWLKTPPKKIDGASVAALADWLHAAYGYQDFAALWREVSARISE
jgi:hypothetical protein